MIPKFRAFNKKDNKMYEVSEISFNVGSIQLVPEKGYIEMYDPILFEGEYTLMQSTGLHDKNDKEIYEGDVISIKHPFRGRTHIGEVIKEAYMYNVKDFYFSHYDIPGDAFSEGTNYMEVIGNIHEHPHLLNT